MDTHSNEGAKRPAAPLLLIGLLPVVAHVAVCGVQTLQQGKMLFRVGDLTVFVLMVAYLVGLLLTATDRRRFARLTLIAYSVLLPILLCEGLVRVLYPLPPARVPWKPMRLTRQPLAGAMPGISGTIEFSVNRYGLRGPSDLDLDVADFRILTVGGSTTECFYVSDQSSWPWRLQDLLSERLGKTVFVGNAGRSGHFTLHHAYLLKHYELTSEFDWVVLMCGINDMGRLLRSDYAERQSKVPEEALTTLRSHPFDFYYRRSALWSLCGSSLESPERSGPGKGEVVQDPKGEWYIRARRTRRRALERGAVTETPAGLPVHLSLYRQNLLRIIAACRERSRKLVMLTQPAMWSKELSPELRALLWQHTSENAAYAAEVLEQILDSYNLAMIEVCQEEQIPCLDLASKLPKDITVFYDDCHFNVSGCQKVAERLCDFFAKVCGEELAL